jgi:hypothetical protein
MISLLSDETADEMTIKTQNLSLKNIPLFAKGGGGDFSN